MGLSEKDLQDPELINELKAMGYVEKQYATLNTKLFLEVRGKKIPANVCNLPFYKKNYVKGEINV